MDRTIENKLFTEFECGYGAASLCLEYIKRMVVNDESPAFDDSTLKFYQSIPERVAQRTASFDEIAWPINLAGEYRIAQEISDNLDKCSSENERNRYINSILQVFEEWAKIFSPMARLQMLEQVLQKSKVGLSHYTEKEVQDEIDRVSGLHDQYLNVMHNAKKGTIEYYFNHWHRAYYKFCNMFAAICVEHNINILEIQNNRGIWLVRSLDVTQIQCYFGYDYNFKYANTLLKALPRTSATEHLILTMRDGVINTEAAWNNNESKPTLDYYAVIPKDLATEKALRYIKIAIEQGLIDSTKNGFVWNGASSVLLDLFFGIIYCGDEIKPSRRYRDEWHLGVDEFPSAALSRMFPAIRNIGQQRVNNLITPHKGVRYRVAPKGWKTVTAIFE